MNEFAKRLKMCRRVKRITQLGLAIELGVSVSAVKAWEKARSFPNNTNIELINDLFEDWRLMTYWTEKTSVGLH